MYDTMSALFIILPVRRFRNCLNDHIHGTIADTVYSCLHLMLVKKRKQIVKLLLAESNDPHIARCIFIRLIHGRCSCTKRTILDQFHRPDRKVLSPLPGTISFFNKSLRILHPLKKALLIMADTQLSSGIQCLVGGHDPTPVFSRKGGKIIGLYPCKSTFIQLLRTVFDVAFHFFLGRCIQYGRIKLYCVLLQKSGIQINLLLNLRELRDFFQKLQTAAVAHSHMPADTHHNDRDFR